MQRPRRPRNLALLTPGTLQSLNNVGRNRVGFTKAGRGHACMLPLALGGLAPLLQELQEELAAVAAVCLRPKASQGPSTSLGDFRSCNFMQQLRWPCCLPAPRAHLSKRHEDPCRFNSCGLLRVGALLAETNHCEHRGRGGRGFCVPPSG